MSYYIKVRQSNRYTMVINVIRFSFKISISNFQIQHRIL